MLTECFKLPTLNSLGFFLSHFSVLFSACSFTALLRVARQIATPDTDFTQLLLLWVVESMVHTFDACFDHR